MSRGSERPGSDRGSLRDPALLLFAVGLLALAACATHQLRVRESFYLRVFDDPLRGTPLGAVLEGKERFEEAWQALVRDDILASRRLFQALVARPPHGVGPRGNYPAHTGLGAVALLEGESREALREFDLVLSLRPDEPEALAGQAAAYHQLGQDERAADSLARLTVVAPDHRGAQLLRERVHTRLRERYLEAARAAEARGDREGALMELRQAMSLTPQESSLFLRVGQLALELRRLSDARDAFAAATRLEPDNPDAWVGLGQANLEDDRPGEAREAFERASRLPGGRERAMEFAQRLRERERQGGPGNGDSPEPSLSGGSLLDRAGLAALLVHRLPPLSRLGLPARPVVVTDIHPSWARRQIQEVVAVGLMQIYENHTFRPEAPVTRAALAGAGAAALRAFRAAGWLAERPPDPRSIVDVPPQHLFYDDVVEVLRYGVMDLDADSQFRPSEPVNGAVALRALDALANLVPTR